MADGHSRLAVLKLADRSDSLTAIQRYLQKFGFKREADPADSTAVGDKGMHKIPGLVDFSMDGSGFANPTFDDMLDAALSFSKSAEYSPRGTGSGRVKLSGSMIVNQYDIEGSFDGPVTCSFGTVGTGPVTKGTN